MSPRQHTIYIYIRTLRDGSEFQSDCIINDNAEVIHKMADSLALLLFSETFYAVICSSFNEKATILKC